MLCLTRRKDESVLIHQDRVLIEIKPIRFKAQKKEVVFAIHAPGWQVLREEVEAKFDRDFADNDDQGGWLLIRRKQSQGVWLHRGDDSIYFRCGEKNGSGVKMHFDASRDYGIVRKEVHTRLHPALTDPKGGDPDEWPEDLRVREVPNGDES